MKPGTVVRWDKLPYPQYGGKSKPRWLICLGCTDCFSNPLQHYFHSTTTQHWTGDHLKLTRAKYPFFSEDCFFYFNEGPYSNTEQELKNPSVRTEGQIDEADLRTIYAGIRLSRSYSRKILLDIHHSLNEIKITGLKKP